MQVSQTEYSERIKERFNLPKYLGSESEFVKLQKDEDIVSVHFHFPNSNGEITVYGKLDKSKTNNPILELKYFTNLTGVPLAFIDVIIELAHKRDFHSLPLLSFREVESFLRDYNHVPAFDGNEISLYRYFDLLPAMVQMIAPKRGIVSQADATTAEKKSPVMEEYAPHSIMFFDQAKFGSFKELERDLKVKIVNEILDHHVNPLLQRDGGEVDCGHVMDNLVVVNFYGNCGTCGMSLTTTMDFIKKVLRTELYDLTLDVISDS